MLGCVISSSPLKTTAILFLGHFTRPSSSPSGLRIVVSTYFANWLFQRLTIIIYFVYGLFHALVDPSAYGGLNKHHHHYSFIELQTRGAPAVTAVTEAIYNFT